MPYVLNFHHIGLIKMNNLLNIFFAENLLPLKVENKRKLLSLHSNYFFIIGLLVKLFFVLVAIPKTHSEWFIPFLDNSINNLNFDPWHDFLKNNSNEASFPYGLSMLLAYLPLSFFGKIIANITSNDYFLGLGFRFSSLIFDYVVLILLSSLTNFRSNKILLFSYWCSPLIIYVNYLHGQLDIVPIMFLVFSICMVKTKNIKQPLYLFH